MEIKYLIRIMLCMLFVSIISCSENSDEEYTSGTDGDIPVTVDLETKSLPDHLKCNMYVFKKLSADNENNYSFIESVPITNTKISKKFANKELDGKSYRFLFLATDKDNPDIVLKNQTTGNTTINTSTKWGDIMISTDKKILSADNYYKVMDMSGEQILGDGSINATLTRMVGQMMIDISRIKNSLDEPEDIQADSIVWSILDRVYQIDILYSGMTKDILIDGQNRITTKNTWESSTQLVTITPDIEANDSLRVKLPQTEKNLEISDWKTKGSLRIRGAYWLPCDKNMRVKYTFYYYDTTPKCGNNHNTGESHTKDCFEKKTLVLNLPEKNSVSNLLSIYPNYYTISKAGIRCDRIIDLDQPSSFSLETIWGNATE